MYPLNGAHTFKHYYAYSYTQVPLEYAVEKLLRKLIIEHFGNF